MKYTVYKTINLLNGKFYIGKHQTENENDSYLGSGKALRNAIKKHGKCNFKKEILFVFDNEQDMNKKEKELITEELVNHPQCYNIGVGGEGGPHFKGKRHTAETRVKMSQFNHNKQSEARAKIKEFKNKSEERKANSDRLKAFWNSPEGIMRRKQYSEMRKQNPLKRKNNNSNPSEAILF